MFRVDAASFFYPYTTCAMTYKLRSRRTFSQAEQDAHQELLSTGRANITGLPVLPNELLLEILSKFLLVLNSDPRQRPMRLLRKIYVAFPCFSGAFSDRSLSSKCFLATCLGTSRSMCQPQATVISSLPPQAHPPLGESSCHRACSTA